VEVDTQGDAFLYAEGDIWFSLALERAQSPVDARMVVLHGAAGLAMLRGNYARAEELIGEWRELAERVGSEAQLRAALNSAALNATEQGDFDDARTQFLAIRERATTAASAPSSFRIRRARRSHSARHS
jgi:ATP/maltotriose-dependent transcriptional regulator MalT